MVYGIYNELVTGANLNQLITVGPHIDRLIFQLFQWVYHDPCFSRVFPMIFPYFSNPQTWPVG